MPYFAQMMMSRPQGLACMQVPFAEVFFFGPERMSACYDDDVNEEQRLASGLGGSTYHTVREEIKREGSQVGHWVPFNPCTLLITFH